jgi:hypothetical protein
LVIATYAVTFLCRQARALARRHVPTRAMVQPTRFNNNHNVGTNAKSLKPTEQLGQPQAVQLSQAAVLNDRHTIFPHIGVNTHNYHRFINF